MTPTTPMSSTPAPPRTWWPWGIVLGLALGVGTLSTMAAIAFSHRSALVPGDPDRDALHHEQVMQARRDAAALGWRVELSACPGFEQGVCTLGLQVFDRDGVAIEDVHGELAATRSDDARWDRSATIEAGVTGYLVPLALGAGGSYRIALRLTHGEQTWVGERELVLLSR